MIMLYLFHLHKVLGTDLLLWHCVSEQIRNGRSGLHAGFQTLSRNHIQLLEEGRSEKAREWG